MQSFSDVLEFVKDYCANSPGVSEIGFKKWISILEADRLENKTAYLYTDNEFTKDTTLEIYADVIKEGFREALGFDVDLVLTVKAVVEAKEEIIAPKTIDKAGYELTFNTFIKGKSNELAYAFSTAVAGINESNQNVNTTDVFNPLYIYGDSGLGKTHLLKAIEHEVKQRHPEYNVIYITGEAFTNELIKAISNKSTTAFHDKYRNCDFLLMDDIQFIAGKDSTQEEFFHTFNDLYNNSKQIVLTADIPPSQMKKLDDRIKSRFVLGVQVDIQAPDFETRMAIIKRKAEVLNLNLSDNVARLIAEKIKTNIRQLEGVVNKMKGLTMFSNETPSIAMAQRIIKENQMDNQPSEITIDKILDEVANAFDVTSDDIRSKNRTAQISLARKMAIYIIKEVKDISFDSIGKELRRDHSTMTILCKDAKDMIGKNSDLKETVEDIMKNLKNN